MKLTRLIEIYIDSTPAGVESFKEVYQSMDDGKPLILTNCLNFFCFEVCDDGYDVKVIKKNGDYILMSELLLNTGEYTVKCMNTGHNVTRMLIAGAFGYKSKKETI